jgi:hypothetical protein
MDSNGRQGEQQTRTHQVLTKQRQHLRGIAILGAAVIVLSIFYGYRNIQGDDSYIFFSYAKNLADGNGYVFNPGERINATSSSLYTLLLAVLYTTLRFIPGATLPLIAHVIGALALMAVSLLLIRVFRGTSESMFACVLPLVFLLNPMLAGAIGMEIFLAMSLALGSLVLYAKNRLKMAALLCSLAVLARPDMLLLAAVMFAYDVVHHRRVLSIRLAGVFLLPIAAWLLFSAFYFGHLIPSTVAAKLAQTEAGLWGEGPVFLKGLVSGAILCSGISHYREAVPFIIVLLSSVAVGTFSGFLTAMARWRAWPLFKHPVFQIILLWNGLYLITYGVLLDAPAYSWYYTPLTLGIALMMTLPLEEICRQLSSDVSAPPRLVVLGIPLSLVAVGVILPLTASRMPVTARHETHKRAAEWLNTHVPEGSSVGANDIGVLRFYYEKGPIIDGVGLVTPSVVEHLTKGEYGWYIREYRPDYLMFIEPPRSAVELMVNEEWFRREYTVDTIIGGAGDGVAIRKRQTS